MPSKKSCGSCVHLSKAPNIDAAVLKIYGDDIRWYCKNGRKLVTSLGEAERCQSHTPKQYRYRKPGTVDHEDVAWRLLNGAAFGEIASDMVIDKATVRRVRDKLDRRDPKLFAKRLLGMVDWLREHDRDILSIMYRAVPEEYKKMLRLTTHKWKRNKDGHKPGKSMADGEYKCEECGKEYNMGKWYRWHMENKHGVVLEGGVADR